ncbi:MAG: SGNH/GDSL hydrolase family protein [Candidatus Omnitrophica bacterium]|nr:SGNH/GDSL hydrolase family protein [Candidatus Omnitrophota bacterium]
MKKNILLCLTSILFCFLFLEATFKIVAFFRPNQTGPSAIAGLPYENVPGARFWRYDREAGFHYYAHNAFGLRGTEVTKDKPTDVFRVALLGDSVAYGGGVGQGQTTADWLERALEGVVPGKKAQVLNFGVASYGLSEYAVLLEEKVLSFSPDAVFVGLCLNDYHIRSESDFASDQKNKPQVVKKERFRNLFKSHFLEFLKNVLFLNAQGFGRGVSDEESIEALSKNPALTSDEKRILAQYCLDAGVPLRLYLKGVAHYISEYRDPVSWQKNEKSFDRIIRLCRDKGVPIYFFAYPLNEQTLEGYTSRMPQDFIRQAVEGRGGNYVELLEGFREYRLAHPNEKMYPRYDNMHMLSNGHRLAASILSAVLKRDYP